MKAEQIYDEDFADRTGPWIGSKRRRDMWQKQRDHYAKWLVEHWLGVDTSEPDVVKIKT